MTGKNATVRQSTDHRPGPAETIWQQLERFSNTWTFDILVRVVYVGWFLFVLSKLLTGLDFYIEAHRSSPDILFFTTVLSRVAVALFFGTLIVLVGVRRKPVQKSRGFVPRLVAFLGTFILMSFPFFSGKRAVSAWTNCFDHAGPCRQRVVHIHGFCARAVYTHHA